MTTTTGRAGIRAYGDVFSLCQVMIGMMQQIILRDGMDSSQLKDNHKDKDTHNNQPKTRGDNGGCKERWHYHQGCERPSFGDNIVGSSGNIC